jgi:hypothetical protein
VGLEVVDAVACGVWWVGVDDGVADGPGEVCGEAVDGVDEVSGVWSLRGLFPARLDEDVLVIDGEAEDDGPPGGCPFWCATTT